MKILVVITSLFCLLVKTQAQTNDKSIRLSVLRKEIIGKTYTFGAWTKEGTTQTDLTYLGRVATNNKKIYKVMNSVWHWGLSHRLTSRILIFDKKNALLGNYYITSAYDLPTALDNGYLIFSNKTNPDCDISTISKVTLKNGLPKEIFRACKGNTGDIYYFSKD